MIKELRLDKKSFSLLLILFILLFYHHHVRLSILCLGHFKLVI